MCKVLCTSWFIFSLDISKIFLKIATKFHVSFQNRMKLDTEAELAIFINSVVRKQCWLSQQTTVLFSNVPSPIRGPVLPPPDCSCRRALLTRKINGACKGRPKRIIVLSRSDNVVRLGEVVRSLSPYRPARSNALPPSLP